MTSMMPMKKLDVAGLNHLSRACGADLAAIMQEVASGGLLLYRANSERAFGTVALRVEDSEEGRELVVVAVGGSGAGLLKALAAPIRRLAAHFGALTIRAHTKSAAMARLHRFIGFTTQARHNGEFVSFAGA